MKKHLGILFISTIVIIQFPLMLVSLLIGLLVMILGIIFKEDKVKGYGFNIMVSVDQTSNTILGGDIDETISSRAGKRQNEQKWARCLCDVLDVVDPGHCDRYIEEDEGQESILDD